MELVEQGRILSYRMFLAMSHGLGLPVSCPLDAQASKWAPVIRQTLSSMGDSMARARGGASAAPSCSSPTAVASSHQLNIAMSFSMPKCIARISVFYLKKQSVGIWEYFRPLQCRRDRPRRLSQLKYISTSKSPPSLCILTCPGVFLPAPNTNKTRCSAIAERPRCRVRYSFRQK